MDLTTFNNSPIRPGCVTIVKMWLEGLSARTISMETGVSMSTVYRRVRRWREGGTVATRPYQIRKSITPPHPTDITSSIRHHTNRTLYPHHTNICCSMSTQEWPKLDAASISQIYYNYIYSLSAKCRYGNLSGCIPVSLNAENTIFKGCAADSKDRDESDSIGGGENPKLNSTPRVSSFIPDVHERRAKGSGLTHSFLSFEYELKEQYIKALSSLISDRSRLQNQTFL